MSSEHVTLIIPTLNAASFAGSFVAALQSQTLQPDLLLVIDTQSQDETKSLYAACGAEIISVSPDEFDHGSTRQFAVERCASTTDIVVFMTQDSIFSSERSLERIVDALKDECVGAAFGRHLPHDTADPISAHSRLFNYPPESQVKSYEDHKLLGLKTCFMSNSFAAYRLSELLKVGGFPDKNIVSEETYVAAKLLKLGLKIKYCAEATVYHSHKYSIREEFQRYFDLGVFHNRNPWIRKQFGGAESEGKLYLLSQWSFLWSEHPTLLPFALLRSVTNYIGYRLGFLEACLPNKFKVRLSMQKHYWQQ